MNSATGIHLFLGADRPRKLQRIQALERSLHIDALDRHQLDGASVSARELVAFCRQRPAASPARLIVVDDAHRLTSDGVGALLRHAETIAQIACVVLLVEQELSLRHALAAAERGVEAQRGLLRVERFPGRDTPAAKPFTLIDALGARDVAGALGAVHDQLQDGREPLEVLGLIGWQVQRWVTVRRLLDAGYAEARIAELAGLRPWQVERMRSEVARRPLDSLQRLLARCWQLDTEAKRGLVLPGPAVEQLVIDICQPASEERVTSGVGG